MKKNLRRLVSTALLVAVLMGFAVPASATVLPMCLTWHGGSLLDTKTESVVGFGTDRSVYYIKAESEVEITLAPGFDGVLQKAYILVAGTSDRIYYFDSSKDAYFAGISIPFTTGTTAEGKSINLSDPSKIYVLIAEATGADGDITQQSFFRVVNEVNGEYVINDEATYTNPLIFKSGLDYDDVSLRDDGYFEIKTDGKYGLLDSMGKEIIAPIYDRFGELSDGMLRVGHSMDGSGNFTSYKWGFVNVETGKLAIPMQYDDSLPLTDFSSYISDFSNGLAVLCVTKNWISGMQNGTEFEKQSCLVDKTGTPMTQMYDVDFMRPYDFSDNRVVAKKDKQYFVMDTQGNILFEAKYDDVRGYKNGFAIVTKNNKAGVIDTQGNVVVKPQYDSINDFCDGLAIVSQYTKNGLRYGAINREGKLVVPIAYEALDDFSDGMALFWEVVPGSDSEMKYGFVNASGEVAVPAIWDYSFDHIEFSDGLARVSIYDERFGPETNQRKHGYVDKQGNVVIPVIYAYATSFSNGIASVGTGVGATGMAGNGAEFEREEITRKFKEWGIYPEHSYIDTSGNVILSAENSFPYGTERFYVDKINGEYAIMRNPIYRETATPNRSTVLVNGEKVAFDAYTINQNNYFKLRDLAKVLSGTGKQFEVTWDGSNNAINMLSGKPYTAVGGELAQGDGANKTATINTATIYLDGQPVSLLAYTINQNNYFKLRDVGQAFDFDVTWDGAQNTIVIDTTQSYTAD